VKLTGWWPEKIHQTGKKVVDDNLVGYSDELVGQWCPSKKEIGMYKNVNINAATTAALIGENTKARVRVIDGSVQVRFSNRTSLVNLPKTEVVRDLYVKGNGRRLGLPSEFAAPLEVGTKVALVPGKYGWFTVSPAGNDNVAASVSA